MRQVEPQRPAPTVAVRLAHLSGVRREDFHTADLEQAIAAHDGEPVAVLKDDARSRVTVVPAGEATVIVKEVKKGGVRRRLADTFRGSPARRGFSAGYALRAAGVGAALPLAFVERSHFGVPLRSLLVSRDLRVFPTAAAQAVRFPEHALTLLCDLAIRLHESGFIHGDLRAQHVHLCGANPIPVLVDLEGVRCERKLSDTQRMQALAQLNASLPDELVPNALRTQAFERYATVLPFEARDAQAQIAELSRARRHLWRGDACGTREAPSTSQA